MLRYSEITGAFITNYTSGRTDEEMYGCAFGPDNNLYVTVNDVGDGAVLRYDGSTGAFLDQFVPLRGGGLSAPTALKFGPGGDLFVGSKLYTNSSLGPAWIGRVLRYDGTNGTFRGVFVANGAGGLSCPFDLTFGPDGNLYVSDSFGTVVGGVGVLRFDGASGAFLGTFIPRGSGGLTNAWGLAFGPDGNCYVSSFDTDSVLRYDGTNGTFIDAFVAAGRGGLSGPQALTFGPDGLLYACSSLTGAVIRYDGKSGSFIDVFIKPGGGGPGFDSRSILFTPRGPRLGIEHSSSGLLLRWPRAVGNFVVEARQTMNPSNNWSQLQMAPTLLGEDWAVTNSGTGNAGFFRLRR